jgi:hypothetical protein
MMTLEAASFSVQSNGELTLPAPLNEWGQPPVAAPPVDVAAGDDDAAAEDVEAVPDFGVAAVPELLDL